MRTKKEIEERMDRLTAGEGKVYDEELCTWHDEYERGLRKMELLWVLTEAECELKKAIDELDRR